MNKEKTFQLSILSPEKAIYQGEAIYLSVPAEDGYLGVLANHAPMISALKPGRFKLHKSQEGMIAFETQKNGFLEVLEDRITILLDAVDSKDLRSLFSQQTEFLVSNRCRDHKLNPSLFR